MLTKTKLLSMASAMTMAVTAYPAMAQAVQVYTNQSLFDSQRPGITSNTFSFAPGIPPIPSPYTQSGVSFASSNLFADNDGAYGANVSYLDAFGGSTLSVTFAGPVLGLTLGSYLNAQTITYNVNGTTGSLTLGANRATSFIGFDTGQANRSINAVFTFRDELDVLGFQTAVPEAATWAMMMVGLGVVGASLRRRQKVSTRVSFARV